MHSSQTNNVFTPWSNPAAVAWSGTQSTVGFEVLSEIGNVVNVKFYTSGTEASAPSRPQDLAASYTNPNTILLNWSRNIEPDTLGYDLYRSIYYDGATLSYIKVNSTLLTSPTFIDNPSIPSGIPSGKDVWWRYNVVAKDNQSKYSVPSEDFWLYVGKTFSGPISTSIPWDTNRIVVGNVTVNIYTTLTIIPSIVVRFASGTSLTVNGAINAQGTQANPILFTSAAGTTQWNGVQIQNGNSIFKYCIFEYGTNGLSLYNATAGVTTDIENCIFRNNGYRGLSLTGSYAKVKSCEMKNNQYGVYCVSNLDIKFIGDSIHHNSQSGVYSYSSNFLEFYGNVIQYNSSSGLSTNNADHIRLGQPFTWSGYNTIRYNGGNEVYVSTGNPFVEICYSSIHDASPYPPYELFNDPANTQQINAYYCFWDTNGCQKSGLVNLNQPQNYIPTAWDGITRTAGSPLGKVAGPTIPDSIPWILDPRIPDTEKIKRCKDIISKTTDPDEATTTLGWLYSIIRTDYVEDNLGEKKTFVDYLQKLRAKSGDTETGKLALRYMIIWIMLENNSEAVIKLSQEALKTFTGEDRKWVLVDLTHAYLYSGQLLEAKNIMQELRGKYGDDKELIALIDNDIIDVGEQIANGLFKLAEQDKPSESETALPTEFGLIQNYPNPFNPSTLISYQLPAAASVKLVVYDMLGREVATLVDGMKDAGIYIATFDGSRFSSGVYFVRITAMSHDGLVPFTKTMKMLMMK